MDYEHNNIENATVWYLYDQLQKRLQELYFEKESRKQNKEPNSHFRWSIIQGCKIHRPLLCRWVNPYQYISWIWD